MPAQSRAALPQHRRLFLNRLHGTRMRRQQLPHCRHIQHPATQHESDRPQHRIHPLPQRQQLPYPPPDRHLRAWSRLINKMQRPHQRRVLIQMPLQQPRHAFAQRLQIPQRRLPLIKRRPVIRLRRRPCLHPWPHFRDHPPQLRHPLRADVQCRCMSTPHRQRLLCSL